MARSRVEKENLEASGGLPSEVLNTYQENLKIVTVNENTFAVRSYDGINDAHIAIDGEIRTISGEISHTLTSVVINHFYDIYASYSGGNIVLSVKDSGTSLPYQSIPGSGESRIGCLYYDNSYRDGEGNMIIATDTWCNPTTNIIEGYTEVLGLSVSNNAYGFFSVGIPVFRRSKIAYNFDGHIAQSFSGTARVTITTQLSDKYSSIGGGYYSLTRTFAQNQQRVLYGGSSDDQSHFPFPSLCSGDYREISPGIERHTLSPGAYSTLFSAIISDFGTVNLGTVRANFTAIITPC